MTVFFRSNYKQPMYVDLLHRDVVILRTIELGPTDERLTQYFLDPTTTSRCSDTRTIELGPTDERS